VGKVRVVVHSVFDTSDPAEDTWLFRRVNDFHVQTRESVVRRELLFSENDSYDSRLLEETERNLRRLPIFRKVVVAAAPAGDGRMEVTVHVYDNWSITPMTSFKRAGGKVAWRAGIKDANLLGYGKTAGAVYGESFTEIEKNFFYEDPQLFGRRLNASWGVLEGGQSKTYYGSLAKPFYATTAQESLGVSASYRDEKIFHDYAVIPFGQVRQRTKEGSVFYGRSLGSTPSMVRRGIFTAGYSRKRIEAIPGESVLSGPDLEAASSLEALFTSEEQAFVKENNVRRLYRDEDINLGWVGVMGMKFSPTWIGSTADSYDQRIELGKGVSFGPGSFFKVKTGVVTRLSGDYLTSVVWNINLEHYKRLLPWNTLAVHLAYDYGHQLNPSNGLLLGELEGLRGYGFYYLSGNRRLLFNLEDRLFLKDNLFRLISLGGVLFFDAGSTWMGEAVAMGSWKTSIGAGLRVASSRGTGGSPLRLDLAYALKENGLPSRWSLSILTGQAF
jgi:outer membrane protein assembly factor BamA